MLVTLTYRCGHTETTSLSKARAGRASRSATESVCPNCWATAQTALVSTAEQPASERQIAYAIDLQRTHWTPAVFGGLRYDRSQLATMRRDEISRVIDALLDERGA